VKRLGQEKKNPNKRQLPITTRVLDSSAQKATDKTLRDGSTAKKSRIARSPAATTSSIDPTVSAALPGVLGEPPFTQAPSSSADVEENDDWVSCHDCKGWHLLPIPIAEAGLGETWHCKDRSSDTKIVDDNEEKIEYCAPQNTRECTPIHLKPKGTGRKKIKKKARKLRESSAQTESHTTLVIAHSNLMKKSGFGYPWRSPLNAEH